MELLLCRHGETDWNRDRRLQGQTDVPLNDTGRAQAAALARELAAEPIDAVYSSDLARAYETARAVAEPHGLEVVPLRALRERDFGSWEGLTDEEIRQRFPDARDRPWGDGETREQLAERVLAVLDELAERHPGGRVVVVAHGGPINALLRHCGAEVVGGPVNCHVSRFAVEAGAVTPID